MNIIRQEDLTTELIVIMELISEIRETNSLN